MFLYYVYDILKNVNNSLTVVKDIAMKKTLLMAFALLYSTHAMADDDYTKFATGLCTGVAMFTEMAIEQHRNGQSEEEILKDLVKFIQEDIQEENAQDAAAMALIVATPYINEAVQTPTNSTAIEKATIAEKLTKKAYDECFSKAMNK